MEKLVKHYERTKKSNEANQLPININTKSVYCSKDVATFNRDEIAELLMSVNELYKQFFEDKESFEDGYTSFLSGYMLVDCDPSVKEALMEEYNKYQDNKYLENYSQ